MRVTEWKQGKVKSNSFGWVILPIPIKYKMEKSYRMEKKKKYKVLSKNIYIKTQNEVR